MCYGKCTLYKPCELHMSYGKCTLYKPYELHMFMVSVHYINLVNCLCLWLVYTI